MGRCFTSKYRTNGHDKLGSFYDLACFQAASADPDSLGAAGHQGADTLKVWIEATVGSVIGVAYTVPKLGPLATDITAFRHCSDTSYEKSAYEDKSEV